MKKNFLLSLLFLFLLFSCKTRPTSKIEISSKDNVPAYGDTLIEGTIGEASNLIPFLASDSASHQVADLIYNGLVKYDKNLNLVGDLAENFKISDGGKKIIFNLRRNVRWHDGKDFTAEDCVFTYKIITDPNTPTPYSGDFLKVKRVYAPDKYTFVVEYTEPFAPALASWGIAIVPKHLLEGKDITKSELSRSPIGTGPYKFDRWIPGDRIILKANDDYFEGRPYIDKIVFKVVLDTSTAFLELRSEGIDFSGLSPLQKAKQTQTEDFRSKFNTYEYLSFSYTYMGFNLKKEIFKDLRVRQAIAYAINKKEIIKGVLFNYGVEATGPYKPDMIYYNPNVERYEYNPDKARTLLKEAGYEDTNGDGILEKDGIPLRFTLLTNQGNEARIKTAEIIQRRLKDVGIEMKIYAIEWAAFIKEFINPRRFDAIILGWTIPQDPDLYDIWHSSKMEKMGLNHLSYKNEEVDRLLEEGRRTFDINKRKKIYFRIQEILAQDCPMVFLYVPYALPVIHKRFKGIEPAPAGIAYNKYKWYVPKMEQKY